MSSPPPPPTLSQESVLSGGDLVAEVTRNLALGGLQTVHHSVAPLYSIADDIRTTVLHQCVFLVRLIARCLDKSQSDRTFRVGVIGCGQLGALVVDALIASGCCAPSQICISSRQTSHLERFRRAGVTLSDHRDNAKTARSARCLFLACLPSQLKEVGASLRGRCRKTTLVCSLVAGTTTSKICQLLGVSHALRALVDVPVLRERSSDFATMRRVSMTHLAARQKAQQAQRAQQAEGGGSGAAGGGAEGGRMLLLGGGGGGGGRGQNISLCEVSALSVVRGEVDGGGSGPLSSPGAAGGPGGAVSGVAPRGARKLMEAIRAFCVGLAFSKDAFEVTRIAELAVLGVVVSKRPVSESKLKADEVREMWERDVGEKESGGCGRHIVRLQGGQIGTPFLAGGKLRSAIWGR